MINNSEFLYIYDVRNSNPNGDPDKMNQPRYDENTERIEVSKYRIGKDVRRFVSLGKGYKVFTHREEDGDVVTSEKRLEELGIDKNDPDILEKLKEFYDVRTFGVVVTIASDKKGSKKKNTEESEEGADKKGKSYKRTGPVQIFWGYSLNKPNLKEHSITSTFASGENKTTGTIGSVQMVDYALIAHGGRISGLNGLATGITEQDVLDLDEALIKSVSLLQSTTKQNRHVRFYVRLEMNSSHEFLDDLRNYIEIENEKIYSIKEAKLDISKLVEYLKDNKQKIKTVYVYHHPLFELKDGDEVTTDFGQYLEKNGFNVVKLNN